MTNHLANSTSPYLRQHATNPVDWYPWGGEALSRAIRENKPVFLSIGYAACHWCHVMAHESFEDPLTAELLNRSFIAIKVDREERPDLDSVYMDAVVAMTGQGGWPMSVFLTPQGAPFFGGTYFPPIRRYGMPSFREVLEAIAKSWQENPRELIHAGEELARHLRLGSSSQRQASPKREGLADQAARSLLAAWSAETSGWGPSPLFPYPMVLEFLLPFAAQGDEKSSLVVRETLFRMAQGGMYDIVEGGFHRYSTDAKWFIPHYEKMLYDNAQLGLTYTHAWQVFKEHRLRQVAEETLDFILARLTHPCGGFFSSLDADTAQGEGSYYALTADELNAISANQQAAGELQDQFFPLHEWTFQGKPLLRLRTPSHKAVLPALRQILQATRADKPQPALDDKVITAWNGLAIEALAEAGRIFRRPDYLAAARRCANFLLSTLEDRKSLFRSWRGGQTSAEAFLEDYASLGLALARLYLADQDPLWLNHALRLGDEINRRFRDSSGKLHDTQLDQPALYLPARSLLDNATPSGNALAVALFILLSELNADPAWLTGCEELICEVQDELSRNPIGYGLWLQNIQRLENKRVEIALAGIPQSPEMEQVLDRLHSMYLPQAVWASTAADEGPQAGLLNEKPARGGKLTMYFCEGFTCLAPLTDLSAIHAQLDLLSGQQD